MPKKLLKQPLTGKYRIVVYGVPNSENAESVTMRRNSKSAAMKVAKEYRSMGYKVDLYLDLSLR